MTQREDRKWDLQLKTGHRLFYQYDERGDTTERFNSSATVLDYHGPDPFGLQFSTGGSPDPYLGFGAQWGYYRDSETALYLCGYRYYDPGYGRFLNQDPSGFGGHQSLQLRLQLADLQRRPERHGRPALVRAVGRCDRE